MDQAMQRPVAGRGERRGWQLGSSPAHSDLPLSFPEHIQQLLEREIIEFRLSPGERVTEDDLAQRLGVSRTPVREAMRVLQGQGLIVRQRGRGTFVAHRTEPHEARTLYELRAVLEGDVAASAASSMRPADIERAAAVQAAFTAVLRESDGFHDVRRLVALDSEFHWTIYNAADSSLLSILASYWGLIQRELYDPVYRSAPDLFARQHEEILTALRAQDPDAAREAMRAHVASGWDALQASYGATVEENAPPPN
jgi:DNA-binding GntR family transcriptional regulator